MIVCVCLGIILRFAAWGYVPGVKSPSLDVRIGRPTLTTRPHERFKFKHSFYLSRLAPPSDRYLQSGSLALYQLRPLVPCPYADFAAPIRPKLTLVVSSYFRVNVGFLTALFYAPHSSLLLPWPILAKLLAAHKVLLCATGPLTTALVVVKPEQP